MKRKRFCCMFFILFLMVLPFSACGTTKETNWVPVRTAAQTEPDLQSSLQIISTENLVQSELASTEPGIYATTNQPIETTAASTPAWTDEPEQEVTEVTLDRTILDSYSENCLETTEGEQQFTYIANINTKKFHLPDCSSVTSMSESNKWYFTGTRDELIEQGYQPCKRCNP